MLARTGVAMPHQPLDPTHDRYERPWLLRLGAVIALFTLVAGACTEPTPELPEPAEPPEASEPEQPPAEQEQDDPPPDPPDADDEVGRLWEAFHAAWVEQAALDDPDPAAFNGLAADPDATIEVLDALRAGGRLVTTETELWPRFDIDDDRAEIVDCAIVSQHPADRPDSVATVTVAWEATATLTDDGWRIETARPGDLFCIAEELNDQLLDAYRDYRQAKDAAWDPPDPEHPDLERTMTGEQLEFIRELLTEHQRDGIVIRDPAPVDSAVVFDVGIGTATVSDCTEQVVERGAFDLETGERLDDLIPPIRDGQLDLQSVELERRLDGSWRVVDQAGTRDTNCEPGSTRYVLP